MDTGKVSLLKARFCSLSMVLLLLGSMGLLAQSGRGSVTGVIRDATEATIPGVDVVAVDKETGVETRALTTDAGVYRLPYLPPGRYRISASIPGFKTAVADNVDVGVAQVVTVDFTLEVGELAEELTVSAATPLLDTSTSEIGNNISEKEVHTWPIIVGDGTRQLQNFVFTSLPGTQGDTFEGSINGGQLYSHEILIEGMSIGRHDLNGGSNNEFTATIDAVGEFKLQTGSLSAQYGGTQTSLVNFGMKSGTNDIHGTLFWFHKNKVLNSNTWIGNATGSERAPFLENNFGGTVGGPILRDRTHFFLSYEGERLTDQNVSGLESIPVGDFKQGDFSKLLDPDFTKDDRSGTVVGTDALGRPVVFGQLYDPATSRQLPDGTWIRDPFPGNVVPTDRFSGVTQRTLQHDIPNAVIDQLRSNFPRVGTCCPELTIDNWSAKIDHVLTNSHKLSGTFVHNDRSRNRFGGGGPQLGGLGFPGPAGAGQKLQATPGFIFRFAEDWTVGPTMLNHFALGYNRFRNSNKSFSVISENDWASELGLQNVGSAGFPDVFFEGFDPVLSGDYPRFGGNESPDSPNGSTIVQDDFTWLRGNHSFRFGFEHRRYYTNDQSLFDTGSYTFHNENTGLPGFVDQTGFAYASFLLGQVQSTDLGIQLTNPGIRSNLTSFYVQDDWKVRPNLTLNLGLRWDIPSPLTEVVERMSGLDPNVPNPGADGYPGALVFLGECAGCTGQDAFSEHYFRQVAPRIGFAWAPGDGETWVFRAGYGINFTPPILDGFSFPYFAGFNGSNPIIARQGRFDEDPVYSWDNPYPAFTDTLPNTDPTLQNGKDIGYYLPETNKMPYVQNWNAGVQTEVGWNTKLEVNYVGNKGTRLEDDFYNNFINQVHPRHLALGDTLLDDIADHPEIPKPYPSFEGTVGRALRPFPQYEEVVTHRLNNGWSSYHALQLTGTKRSDYGLSFLAAYTFSKSLATSDTAGPGDYAYNSQDFYNREADYSVTSFHFPHDFKLTWIYDLPFGPGANWLTSGPLSKVFGGWTVSVIQRYRSGPPLSILSSGLRNDALFNPDFRGDVILPADQHKLTDGVPDDIDISTGTPFLNPDAFGAIPRTDRGVPLRLGNASRYDPKLRGFAFMREDLSLVKRTGLGFREDMNFEIRVDAINLLNRTTPFNPVTNTGDPARFGRIFGKGGNRTIQLGLRLSF